MPDWFYRTVAQRTLFCLPDKAGRTLALGVIGTLGRNAPGRALIDFLGHMDADPRLAVRVGGTGFPSRIGLGWRVDPDLRATEGLGRFGVGCIEIQSGIRRDVKRGPGLSLLDLPSGGTNAPVGSVGAPPLLRRCVAIDGSETVQLPSGITLPVAVWDQAPTANHGDGTVLQVGSRQGAGWQVPLNMPETLPDQVRLWRSHLPTGATLVVAGGVAGPGDAVELVNAGADLILVDAGLVYSGPGLVKRCNEALLGRLPPGDAASPPGNLFRQAWFWAAASGAALALGGLATLFLALTRVLLPYDEHYLGLTAETMRRNSPKLFAFMAHDRGTLAGTMLGLGWVYLVLASQGVKRGIHGAKTAVVASALAGFVSFFAFFGFGYFDTLHAFVAAVLFQFTVQIMVGAEGAVGNEGGPPDHEDAGWRRAQWGALFWLIHATGLLIAGAVILGIGMTSVFVSEDLNFLCLTATQARDFGARTMGVVAHDRATLGGMLLASGVVMLLAVLRCHRRSAAWLWWAFAGLGVPAYTTALGVHFWVGYTDWRHIVPALIGLGLWLGGLIFSHGYLAKNPAR